MAHLIRFAALLLLVTVLAGCGERTAAPTITDSPLRATIGAPEDCPRPALENWLQRSSNLTQEFSDLVNNNIAIQPSQALGVLDQIASIRAAFIAARAPQCALQHAIALGRATDIAAAYFDAYRRGEATDAVSSITLINSAIDEARALEQVLLSLYDTLP
ncbi:MAG: hypothetical protein DYG88_09060 [Chloroflexi bacterium CFX4]|nr:hypothetical protein [Chloroflexi bacterium CFX4]MDL1922236.1 hypothetical protein [Chloroflexi bacterium CFX3]